MAEYETILAELQKNLPNTRIFVNSILPATEVGIKTESSWSQIPEYSEAVHEMVEENGYGWVDCDGIVEENKDMYETDGIHMMSPFYPYWATQMMLSVYDADSSSEDGTESAASETA